MPSPAPRTLADQFRSWPDEQLSALLEARPDLATPAPHDSSQLAARVVVKASVLRALDGLDALELAVLQALVQDTDPADLPADARSRDAPALERLRTLALVWGSPTGRCSSSATCSACPPVRRSRRCPVLLERLEPPARAILDHLDETGADGRWSGGAGPTADLVASGLLARIDERHVTLPWSVRLGLVDATPVGGSTSRPSWRPPSARRRWSTGPRPAPRSSSYDAPSCSSTGGAPTRRPR